MSSSHPESQVQVQVGSNICICIINSLNYMHWCIGALVCLKKLKINIFVASASAGYQRDGESTH